MQIKLVNSSGNLNTAKRLLRNNAIIKTHGRHEDIRTLRNADELAQKTHSQRVTLTNLSWKNC